MVVALVLIKWSGSEVFCCSYIVIFFLLYRKIPIIRPGFIFVKKTFSLGLFSGELIIGGNFEFQYGLDLTIKTA